MNQFLLLNPGLKSRFPFIINFEDYGADELIDIAKQMILKREYRLTNEAEWKLRTHLIKKVNTKEYNFSNGRYIRNIIEHSIRMHAVRLLSNEQFSREDLIALTEADLQFD